MFVVSLATVLYMAKPDAQVLASIPCLLVMAWCLIIGTDFLFIRRKIAFLEVTSGPVWGSPFGCVLVAGASTFSS